MEREKEIAKLVNVLRRTSRMALQSEWTGTNQDAAAFCVDQYNRVLARLKEIDPNVSVVFQPLEPGSSLTVVAMACRQLASYYEDEVGSGGFGGFGRARAYGFHFDPKIFQSFCEGAISFKEFWEKSARDFEDFGESIREAFEDWARKRKKERSEESKSQ